MAESFNEAVQELAVLARVDPSLALEDEHVRWAVYEASVSDPERHRLLQVAVCGEVNAPLASAVVTRVLEAISDGERGQWVDLLPPGRLQEFARTRAAELHVWDDLADGALGESRRGELGGWSQWLQLRAAEQSNIVWVLDELSRIGATKRIRRLAHERL
ncbi:hypothetical protein LEP48_04090 [Isoptericola sp. NEAU-Y5]|uniref:Uncharacterized protein n=1 Tax=Isoptericola luteus TaxID=2879484 RepID=A0ABS7ZBV5_9MICO|nr:hypothetical protein [Isoptericola sp. NEAU-Y5]MCA5892533.1 hypothetical protein [Isoptericola sp. NEAU-Y5]